MSTTDELIDPTFDLTVRGLAVVAIVAAAVALHGGLRVTIRWLTRRAVRRARRGRGSWNLRLPRTDEGGLSELRRLQRADAAAHMLARLTSLVVGTGTTLAISHLLGVDPLVVLSSAGFLGAGLAFGGQSVIKDWLTGLIVLLEDRYAVGDRLTLTVAGGEVSGTVETLTGVGLRLRKDDGTTWHAGHGSIDCVTNLSQQMIPNQIDIPVDVWAQLDQTMVGPAINAASHDLGLTDVLLVSDIAEVAEENGIASVTIHASRPLNERQRKLVAKRIGEVGASASPSPRPRGDASEA